MALTEDQIRTAIEEITEEDASCSSWAITRDTISDFRAAAEHYKEAATPIVGNTANGVPYLFFDRVQVAKGCERTSLLVIDGGDVRYVLT